ncbi:MAG: Kelch repeat-containing protein [Candidatus Heimdallarchaeaceae archaeon]
MKIKEILRKKVFTPAIFVITLLLIATNTTVEVSAAYPLKRVGHCMIYDSVNDRIIMYGGQPDATYVSYRTDTWVYDLNNNTWIKMSPESVPYQKTSSKMVYDSESEKLINFGGTHAENYLSNQTWIYDYLEDSWTNANPANTPRLRSSHAMAYDSESDIVIMFGGGIPKDYNPYGGNMGYNDTWSYDYNSNTWTNMTPSISPLGRQNSILTYDSESDKIVLFGGFHSPITSAYLDPTGEVYQRDTWTYDYNTNTWENVTPSTSPDPRIGFNMAYDSESDRILLFGGSTHLDTTGMEDEVWSFDLNSVTWTQMNPATTGRRSFSIAYDSESDKIVLFGGTNSTTLTSYNAETWVYDYNADTWTLMEVPEVTEDSNAFLIPTILSLAIIAIVLLKRRKNN